MLGLSVFLCFCLVFESYLTVPDWVLWLGKWHPVLLHFPIVLLLLVIFLGFTRRRIPTVLFQIAILSALLTAITGFFLAMETVGKGALLWWHQYLGAGVALLAAFWYAFRAELSGFTYASRILQTILLGLILTTGHFGGQITHGEDFLALPGSPVKREIPENPLIYEDVVLVIMDDHCTKCHNANKRKGELLLTDLSGLMKGGESGNTLIPGSPEGSELIRRLHLPEADEEHMPPEGESPLREGQIRMIERWIALGASDTLRLNDLEIDEPLLGLIKQLQQPDREQKWAELPKVADTTLHKLENDYLTIRRITQQSQALSVNVYNPPAYDSIMVTRLRQVAANIVELDISALPIGSTELELVGAFPNLEWLEIDRTPISDSDITPLASLAKLEVLKVYETKLGDSSLQTLAAMKNLRHVYLHDTRFTVEALDKWQQEHPDISIHSGIPPEYIPDGSPIDSTLQAL